MNRIENHFRATGRRLTGPRKLIAQALAEATDHPSVEELHRRVSLRDCSVSLATIYRTVKHLEEAGILARHEFQDGRGRYEKASKAHHDHLIDVETGDVIEFQSREIEALQRAIARKLGFRLVAHRLELYGSRDAR